MSTIDHTAPGWTRPRLLDPAHLADRVAAFTAAEAQIAAAQAARANVVADLYTDDGLSFDDIEALLGVPEATARTWIRDDPRYADAARLHKRRRNPRLPAADLLPPPPFQRRPRRTP